MKLCTVGETRFISKFHVLDRNCEVKLVVETGLSVTKAVEFISCFIRDPNEPCNILISLEESLEETEGSFEAK